MLRLFFALQPPVETSVRLLEAAAPLLAELAAQAVPVTNLHATLCFMGAVAPERLDELCSAAARVRATAIELDFDEFDFWEKPKVLVAGASRESVAAGSLSAALQAGTLEAGFSPDPKIFRAHLTLARKIPVSKARKIPWPQKISPGFVVRCEEFSLMESRKSEHGSIYSVIASWPLDAREESRVTQ